VKDSDNTAKEATISIATSDMGDLSNLLARTFLSAVGSSKQSAIEGLAYASIRPEVKEKLAFDRTFLQTLHESLKSSPAKSSISFGCLSILANLTSYMPTRSEEEKRLEQLKAYANAQKPASSVNILNDDAHVAKRCMAVFEAGVVPVLVTHSLHGSTASLLLVTSIIFSIARLPKVRGQLAQQGAVRLLLHAYTILPETELQSRRLAAHALALILISTNPAHVFGGTNPHPLISAIKPLLSLLVDDPAAASSSLLPTFEALLALTNLASTDDTARNSIIRTAFPVIDDLLLSSNSMVTRATVELLCNLMPSSLCVEKFANGSKQASNRTHILLALADAEDMKTRMAAGGALASLTEWDTAVNTILERHNGAKLVLGLCMETEEGLRHRGAVCVLNMISIDGEVGNWALNKVLDAGGEEILKDCLKKSRSQEVVGITVEALKKLLAARASDMQTPVGVD
jgi:protein unc-45